MYSVNYLQVTVGNTIELQEDHSVYDDHLLLKERTDRQWSSHCYINTSVEI
jgi:hypothetical protein